MEYADEKLLLIALHDPQQRRQAFEGLVRTYQEPLYRQIRHMVLSHDDANDLLQNTFIKAWTNLDNFRGESKISTWLYRIALNECKNFLTREHNKYSLFIDDPEERLCDQMEGDTFFDGDRAQKLLQQAILSLPEKQRMVFNMKYYQEMKYEEISEIFGTTVGALKASYHYAVKKIEDFLESHL